MYKFSLRKLLVNKNLNISTHFFDGPNLDNQIKKRIISCFSDNLMTKYSLLDNYEMGLPALVVIITSRNNAPYVRQNLKSVAIQNYPNFRIIYLDDQSDDGNYMLVDKISKELEIDNILSLVSMPERNRQGASRFRGYHMCDDDEIICMLDGDDWFYDENCLTRVAQEYKKGAMVTYGSYFRFANGKLGTHLYGPSEDFPKGVFKMRDFRNHRWVTQHLRTAYAGLFKRIRYLDLVDQDNKFLTVATDVCEMMPVLEMASPHIYKISSPTYVYNIDASNRHNSSYFRVNDFPEQKFIRQRAMAHIKATKKYPKIERGQIISGRQLKANYKVFNNLSEMNNYCNNIDYPSNIDYLIINGKDYSEDYLAKLVKYLDIYQLALLIEGLKTPNTRFVHSKHVGIVKYFGKPLVTGFCIFSPTLLGKILINDDKKRFTIDYQGTLISII